MGKRHVIPSQRPGEGWQVTEASTGEPEYHAANQADAVDRACAELARNGGGEVVIHGIRGLVQDKRTVRPAG